MSSVMRLVAHENPEGRQTPLLLLAQLRELDPTVELVYFGARDWRLGAVRPSAIRYEKGERILRDTESLPLAQRNPKNVMLGLLSKQGFAQITKYIEPADGDISGTVLLEDGTPVTVFNHFQRAHFLDQKDKGEAAVKDALFGQAERAEAETRRRHRDYLDTDGRAHHARVMRNRVTMGAGGFTGLTSGLSQSPPRRIVTGEEVMADIAEIMRELGGEVPSF